MEREDVIGKGETFLVQRCSVQEQVYAIKNLRVDKYTVSSPDFRKRLKSVLLEIRIMCHPPLRDHPNIQSVNFYGWDNQPDRVLPYLIVEYSPYGTLRNYLQTVESNLSRKQILMGDVAMGVHSLHGAGIVHGDIKLENVLVFQSWDRPAGAIARISDFGHSLLTEDASGSKKLHVYHGTSMSVIIPRYITNIPWLSQLIASMLPKFPPDLR